MQNNQSDCLCDVTIHDGYTGKGTVSNSKTSFQYIIDSAPNLQTQLILKDMNEPTAGQNIKMQIPLPAYFHSYMEFPQDALPYGASDRPADGVTDFMLQYQVTFISTSGASQGSPIIQTLSTATTLLPGINPGGIFTKAIQTNPNPFDQLKSSNKPFTLRFYKDDSQNLSLTRPDESAKPMCQPRKTNFRLCVVPPDPLPIAGLTYDGKITQSSITVPIRFSIELKDLTPQPVSDSTLYAQYDTGTGTIDVSFSKSSSTDIDHYAIYCSDTAYPNKNVPIDAPTQVYTPAPSDVEPFKVTIATCAPAASTLDSNKDYYIMVVPVDQSGQAPAENPSKKATKS